MTNDQFLLAKGSPLMDKGANGDVLEEEETTEGQITSGSSQTTMEPLVNARRSI